MGWQDREYNQQPGYRDSMFLGGIPKPTTLARSLIFLHAGGFIAVWLLRRVAPTDAGTYLEGITSQFAISPLTILLHPFTIHSEMIFGGVLRLAFVVWAIWSLGRVLDERMGTRQIVTLYVLGNLVAGATYYLATLVLPALSMAPLDYPLGALAAWCLFVWRECQFDYVPVFTKTWPLARVVAIAVGIVFALAFLSHGSGMLMLLGAAGAGAVTLFVPTSLTRLRWHRAPTRKRTVVKPSIPSQFETPGAAGATPPNEPTTDADIDDILEKISRSGIESLTDAERKRLEAARQARLERSSS